MREKIFGLSGAAVHKLDVKALRKAAAEDDAAKFCAEYRERYNPGFTTYGPKTRRVFVALSKGRNGLPA
jgi:hypothetical protein